MRVQNMRSPKSGRDVCNQFIIVDDDGSEYFQSYSSIIVKCDNKENKTYLDEFYWNYSRTTSKYRNAFLGLTTDETRAKIKSGDLILTNLN